MAQTFRHLWPTMISWDHLVASYHRCRRRKRYKIPAVRFHHLWESNLRRLQSELCHENWTPGQYYNFRITDPKPRLISAAPFRDRIVHHALVGVMEPLFERRFIYDSYACRKGKGTHRAIKRTQYYLRRHPWYLKTDIVKFFPSVDHLLMRDAVSRVIRDDAVMRLVELILESGNQLPADQNGPTWFAGDDLFAALRPKGLPIGNLTSQFFANVFLDPIDHFVKEELRVPGYVRYADDLLLFGDTKEQLWGWRGRLIKRLEECRLQLHRDKTIVARSDQGVKYLGFRVFPNRRRASQDAILRFNRKRRNWIWKIEHGQCMLSDVRQSLSASLAHLGHCNSIGIRRALMRRVRFKVHRRER